MTNSAIKWSRKSVKNRFRNASIPFLNGKKNWNGFQEPLGYSLEYNLMNDWKYDCKEFKYRKFKLIKYRCHIFNHSLVNIRGYNRGIPWTPFTFFLIEERTSLNPWNGLCDFFFLGGGCFCTRFVNLSFEFPAKCFNFTLFVLVMWCFLW